MKTVCNEYKISYKGFSAFRITGQEHGKNDILIEFYKNEDYIFSEVIYTTIDIAERDTIKNYKKIIDKNNIED